MNPSKWTLVSMLVLTLISAAWSANDRQQKRHVPVIQVSRSPNSPSYWEHILREFVFKTISPPPPSNNQLYRHLLEAPFYGGPFPIVPNDTASVVLSRGDVYYLPDGHWLFCQEGCSNCEVCREHTHPIVKWTLRRIKRHSSHGPPRHDLQLTIVPQSDGSYHMSNLWPRSYVYVTTQGEQAAYSSDKQGHEGEVSAYPGYDDSSSGQRPRSSNFWKLVERDSLAERRVPGEQSNDTEQPFDSDSRQNISTTLPPVAETTVVSKGNDASSHSKEQSTRAKLPDRLTANDTSAPPVLTESNRNRIRQPIPRLILGTDQLGQRHLVHVVPLETSTNGNLTNSVLASPPNKNSYQRLLRRIFNSLINNRPYIENFLDPLTQAGSNQQVETHQQQESKHGFRGLRRRRRPYRIYSGENRNGLSGSRRQPRTLNRKRQRRKSNDDANAIGFISNSISENHTSDDNHDLYSEIRNANISSILGQDSKNVGVVDRFNSKSIDRNYYSGSAFNSGMGSNNATRNGREYGFEPRKFKIVVTTESTTEHSNNSSAIRKFKLSNSG